MNSLNMNNQAQNLEQQLLPFDKIIKPGQVASLGCLTPDQKSNYFGGIQGLWRKIQENPNPESQERLAAHKRLSEISNHLRNQMLKWKAEQGQNMQQQAMGQPVMARPGQGQQQISGAEQGQGQDMGNPMVGQSDQRQVPPQQAPTEFSQKVKEQARQLQVFIPPQHRSRSQEEIQRFINMHKKQYAMLLARLENYQKEYINIRNQVEARQKAVNRPFTAEERDAIQTRMAQVQAAMSEARTAAMQYKQSREDPQAAQQAAQQAQLQAQQQAQQQQQQAHRQAQQQAHQQVQQQAQQAQQQAQQAQQQKQAQQQAAQRIAQQQQAQRNQQLQAQQQIQQQQQAHQQAQTQQAQQQQAQQQQAQASSVQQNLQQENQQRAAQGNDGPKSESKADASDPSVKMEVDRRPSVTGERPPTASDAAQNSVSQVQTQAAAAATQQNQAVVNPVPAGQTTQAASQGTPTTAQAPYPLSHEMAISRAAQSYSQNPPRTTHGHPSQAPEPPSIQRENSNSNASTSTPSATRPPNRPLSVAPVMPVTLPPPRPTLSGGPNTMGPMGQPAIQRPPMYNLEGDGERVLSKKKLEDLVRQVTGGAAGENTESLDPDVEETLLDVADEFVDNVITAACRVAKLRGSAMLELRDIQLILERNYNIRVPGYASDELRTVKKIQPTQAWTAKLSAIQAAKVTAGKKLDL